jgi:hypothetical protein
VVNLYFIFFLLLLSLWYDCGRFLLLGGRWQWW